MKRLLYFPLGVVLLIYDGIRYITKRGDIAVSNYEFYKRMEKHSKERA